MIGEAIMHITTPIDGYQPFVVVFVIFCIIEISMMIIVNAFEQITFPVPNLFERFGDAAFVYGYPFVAN